MKLLMERHGSFQKPSEIHPQIKGTLIYFCITHPLFMLRLVCSLLYWMMFSQSSCKQPPWKFEKVVVTRAGHFNMRMSPR